MLADDLAAGPTRDRVNRLAELLERSGISVDDIGRIERVNAWQGFHKNAEGEAEVVDLVGITISPAWADGPAWPVVQPAAPTVIRPTKAPRSPRVGRVILFIPDMQFGYIRTPDGEMIPMHDPRAVQLYLQLVALLKPDCIVVLGDYLDLSEFSSKFILWPEFQQTTQPAIEDGHQFLAGLRATAGPDCEMVLFAGNHDDRMAKLVAVNAKAALRLKRADNPSGWPVLSVPNLLRVDDLKIDYVSGYPAGKRTICKGGPGITPLVAQHGVKTDLAKVAKESRQSIVQGHSHHLGMVPHTYEVDGEMILVWALSPGCGCRTDGVVPSTGSALDDMGRPVRRHENWQQGAMVVVELDDGFWMPEMIPFHDGRALWRGRMLDASSQER